MLTQLAVCSFWVLKCFIASVMLCRAAQRILEDIVPMNLGKRYTPCKLASVCRVFKCVFNDVCLCVQAIDGVFCLKVTVGSVIAKVDRVVSNCFVFDNDLMFYTS